MENNAHYLIGIIEEIAKEKEITNYRLAQLSGLKENQISAYFSHKTMPSLENFLRLCKSVELNLFLEDRNSDSKNNLDFEKAMTELGRRPKNMPKN